MDRGKCQSAASVWTAAVRPMQDAAARAGGGGAQLREGVVGRQMQEVRAEQAARCCTGSLFCLCERWMTGSRTVLWRGHSGVSSVLALPQRISVKTALAKLAQVPTRTANTPPAAQPVQAPRPAFNQGRPRITKARGGCSKPESVTPTNKVCPGSHTDRRVPRHHLLGYDIVDRHGQRVDEQAEVAQQHVVCLRLGDARRVAGRGRPTGHHADGPCHCQPYACSKAGGARQGDIKGQQADARGPSR